MSTSPPRNPMNKKSWTVPVPFLITSALLHVTAMVFFDVSGARLAMAKATYPKVAFVGPILEEPKMDVRVSEERTTLLGARKRSFDWPASRIAAAASGAAAWAAEERDPFKQLRAGVALRPLVGGQKALPQ